MQQRAFLASSLQQNLEIQKQLLQQNQQLQQLLAQAVSTPPTPVALSNGADPIMNRSTSMSSLAYPISPIFTGKLSTPDPTSATTSPKPSEINPIATPVKSFKLNPQNNNGSNSVIKIIPPPPPPPPPPPISPGTDVFGRAKTVRIGKWRWPPPSEDQTENNFIEFKRKKQIEKQDKVTNGNAEATENKLVPAQNNGPKESVAENGTSEPEVKKPIAPITSLATTEKLRKFGESQTSVPGSIGKLRISMEMRAKLEQLTIDQSVRSKKDGSERGVVQSQSMDDLANMNSVKKLSEQRKALLERQLMGSLRNTTTFMETASTPNIKQTVDIVSEQTFHTKLVQETSVATSYEPSAHVKKFIKNQHNLLRKTGSREFRERREELGPYNRLSSSSSHVNYSDRPLYTPERFFHKDEIVNGHFDTESAHSSHNGRHSSSSGRFYNGHFSPHASQQSKPKRVNIPPPPPPEADMNGGGPYGPPSRRARDHLEHLENIEFIKPLNGAAAEHTGEIDEKQVKTKLFLKNEINFYTYSKPKFRLNIRKEVSGLILSFFFSGNVFMFGECLGLYTERNY